MSKRVKVGDVIQLNGSGVTAYLQFVGRHAGLFPMDAFAVLQGPCSGALDASDISKLRPAYFVGSLLKAVVKDPSSSIIGACSEAEMPKTWRVARLDGWHLVTDGHESPSTLVLDDQTAALPIVALIPVNVVLKRVRDGWRPTDDRLNLSEQIGNAVNGAKTANRLIVYFDFRNKSDLAKAIEALKKRSLEFVRSKTNDLALQVLVACPEIAAQADWWQAKEASVRDLVETCGGIYDGNDVSI